MGSIHQNGYQQHTCVACGKPISWSFAICSQCEKIYGHSMYQWPDWLRFYWCDEQRLRRQNNKLHKYECDMTDIEDDTDINDLFM